VMNMQRVEQAIGRAAEDPIQECCEG
jgi:hypothetical protein